MVEKFIIKLAKMDDMKAVFDLSNDELVRANSFNSEKIEWENHQAWFINKLHDENNLFYLIKDLQGDLIAQVRFDRTDDTQGDISISVTSAFRGKGYGAKVLKAVSEKIITKKKIKKINAYIKNENKASQSIFEKANYKLKEKHSDKMRYEYNAQ